MFFPSYPESQIADPDILENFVSFLVGLTNIGETTPARGQVEQRLAVLGVERFGGHSLALNGSFRGMRLCARWYGAMVGPHAISKYLEEDRQFLQAKGL